MRCPFCREENDKVIDSRASQDGFSIRRRRQCISCTRRYTTYERIHELGLRVIKKGGIQEPFDPQKIRKGLQKACWKRNIGDEQIERVVNAVEERVYSSFDAEIDASELGEIVMEFLAELDQVAYVRFASVYREFTDVRDFVDELRPMLSPKEKKTKS